MSVDMKFLQEFHKIILSYESAIQNFKFQNTVKKKYNSSNQNNRQEESINLSKLKISEDYFMIIDSKMSIQNAVINDPIKFEKIRLK